MVAGLAGSIFGVVDMCIGCKHVFIKFSNGVPLRMVSPVVTITGSS